MSYAGPRGVRHYRLYKIPSHPFIPPFVSDPGREREEQRSAVEMEVEVQKERERDGGRRDGDRKSEG